LDGFKYVALDLRIAGGLKCFWRLPLSNEVGNIFTAFSQLLKARDISNILIDKLVYIKLALLSGFNVFWGRLRSKQLLTKLIKLKIFKGLTYQDPRVFSDPEEENVFCPDEAYRLAKAVAEVLGSLDSTQRIRFASYNWGGGTLFSKQRKSEGVIFLKPRTKLNIAFTVINMDGDPGRAYENSYLKVTNDDPLRITFYQKPIQPKEWYTLMPADEAGETHSLWVVVDLDKVRGFFGKKPEAETIVPKGPVPAPEVKEEDDLKRKLKRLKEYHDEGLIDEEEYKAKKKELLEGVKD